MSAHYQPREQPFLNDPAAYPEFSLLVKRERINHAVRFGLHRHRTAALLGLVAVSIAASGGEMPQFWVEGGGGGGGGEASSGGAAWSAYLCKGINATLIERHFEGLVSALGCMLVSCLTALLAYPIYLVASPAASHDPAVPPRRCRSNLAARIIAAAAPSTAVWAFAVRAAGLFRWGIASGLCVGLLCAALTLKSVSFVQQACPSWPMPARRRTSLDASDGGAAAGGGSCTAGVTAAAAAAAAAAARGGSASDGPRTRSRREKEGADDAAGVDDDASAPEQRQGQQRSRRSHSSAPRPPSPSAGSRSSSSSSSSSTARPPPLLTFGEFAFFLLLAPSLVCEPRLLVSRARRPRRIAAAASEFFHAGLTYLAVHAACSAFFAPIMRVLAAALHSGWADVDGWAELHRADGSGWWLLQDGGGGCGAGEGGGGGGGGGVCGEAGPGGVEGFGQQGLGTVAVAGCLGMLVFTPLMHFLMFYAFFHSVCLGCAELWGYPDRNIYGPWWLVMDDIRDYFRLWSAPVHRWLSKTIQRPMIEAGQREALRHRRRHASPREGAEPCEKRGGLPRETRSTNGNVSGHGSGGPGGGGEGNGDDGGGGKAIISRWWMASVVCSFLVSGVLHEAVAFIAMRRTFWPFNTFFLCVSASMTPVWDALFPVVAPAGGVSDLSSGASRSAAAGGGLSAAGSDTPGRPAAAAETSTRAAVPPASPAETDKARRRNGGAPSSNRGAPGSNGRTQPGPRAAAAASPDSPKLDGGDGGDVDSPEERGGQEGSEPPAPPRRRGAARPKMGSWRGWTPIVFYVVASTPVTLALHYLVWQYWRHTFLVD